MGKTDLWGWYLSLTAVPAILWLISYPFTGKSKFFTRWNDLRWPWTDQLWPKAANVLDSKIARTEKSPQLKNNKKFSRITSLYFDWIEKRTDDVPFWPHLTIRFVLECQTCKMKPIGRATFFASSSFRPVFKFLIGQYSRPIRISLCVGGRFVGFEFTYQKAVDTTSSNKWK